jgi:DNA-binding NtrC family response regulator
MANILIIDDQAWVIDLCRKGLAGEGHLVLATDDIESVRKDVLAFKPDLVLLNQYLKHGFHANDILWDIKMQDTDLPVLIVTDDDSICLSSSRLIQADGHLVKSHNAANELGQRVSMLLNRDIKKLQSQDRCQGKQEKLCMCLS